MKPRALLTLALEQRLPREQPLVRRVGLAQGDLLRFDLLPESRELLAQVGLLFIERAEPLFLAGLLVVQPPALDLHLFRGDRRAS